MKLPVDMLAPAAALAIALAVGFPAHADAELLAALNASRSQGCGGKPGAARPLAADAKLSEAARLLSQKVGAGDAMQRAGYRATGWAVVGMSGPSTAEAIAERVSKNFCPHLVDAAFAEIGVHRQHNQTWIVFAAPFAPPLAADAANVGRRVLELVNAARAQARDCGGRRFAPAGPLRLNETLGRAAQVHSDDMAAKDFFSHDGSDGSTVMIRSTRVGYNWRGVGENIASGQTTPEGAVEGWIKSPSHCANLMNPKFTEMGVAFTANSASQRGVYWTQVLGTPR